MNLLPLSLSGVVSQPEPQSDTSFARLSQDAQDTIVNAVVGNEVGELSDSVKEEIRRWVIE